MIKRLAFSLFSFILLSSNSNAKSLRTASNGEYRFVIQKGHKGSVRGMAIQPQGKYALSKGDDGTVRLWNIRGHLLRVFRLNVKGGERIYWVSFSANGQHIIISARPGIFIYSIKGRLTDTWLLRSNRFLVRPWIHRLALLEKSNTLFFMDIKSGHEPVDLYSMKITLNGTMKEPKKIREAIFASISINNSRSGLAVSQHQIAVFKNKTIRTFLHDGTPTINLIAYSDRNINEIVIDQKSGKIATLYYIDNNERNKKKKFEKSMKVWNQKGKLIHTLDGGGYDIEFSENRPA